MFNVLTEGWRAETVQETDTPLGRSTAIIIAETLRILWVSELVRAQDRMEFNSSASLRATLQGCK